MSEYAPQPAADVQSSSSQSAAIEEAQQRLYGPAVAMGPGGGSPESISAAVGHYAEGDGDSQKARDERVERKTTGLDLISKSIDVAGYAFGDGTRDITGRVASAFAIPGDASKAAKAIRDGNISDAFNGGAGVVSDLAGVFGLEGLASVSGIAKGTNETVRGSEELDKGEQNDNGLQMVEGLRHTLDGLVDTGGSVPQKHVAGTAKAFGLGLAVGDAIAPTVFGDKNVSSDVQKSDGTFVASTGNQYIDWALGEGKYSDSRLEGDGVSGEERAGQARYAEMKAETEATKATLDAEMEGASPEKRELIESQKEAMDIMLGLAGK